MTDAHQLETWDQRDRGLRFVGVHTDSHGLRPDLWVPSRSPVVGVAVESLVMLRISDPPPLPPPRENSPN